MAGKNIYIGSIKADKLYIGDTTVDKVYLGNVLVWQNTCVVTWSYMDSYGHYTTTTTLVTPGDIPTAPVTPDIMTSENSRYVPGNWDDLSPISEPRTITMSYTQQYNVTISSSYCTANVSSGWRNANTVITWTANDNYSFGGSSVKDTTTATITEAKTYSATPRYIKCTISGTRCSANKDSGSILAVNTSITWTASSTDFSFVGGLNRQATDSALVTLGTTSYSKSADYRICNFSGTNCKYPGFNSGSHYKIGAKLVWSADSMYSFGEGTATTAPKTSTEYILENKKNYSATAGYHYASFNSTRCTVDLSVGYWLIGHTITWTADTGYAFNSSGKSTYTSTVGTDSLYSASADYEDITITGTRCTADLSDGYNLIGATITWTADTGYAFSEGNMTTVTATIAAGTSSYSKSANYMRGVTISGTNCTANVSSGTRAIGTVITWTANTNYAFDSSGTTTSTATISAGTWSYSKAPGYVNVTEYSGTNCSTSASTGWKAAGTAITWTADTAYAFDTSNTTTITTAAIAGKNSCTASFVKRYTLYISATGTSYLSSYSVSRTSSPYQGASTGVLSDRATIYYGDKLSQSCNAADTRYGSWDYESSAFTVCTGSWNGGDTTSPSITVTAANAAPANLYYYNNGWVHLAGNWCNKSGYNNSYTLSGLAFDTTYTFHVAGNHSRSYWTRSESHSISGSYDSSTGVYGAVTASFTGSENSAQTETAWTGDSPSTVDISTGSVNCYDVKWSNTGGVWDNYATMENVPYNTLVSYTTGGTAVTINGYGTRTFNISNTAKTTSYRYYFTDSNYYFNVTNGQVTGKNLTVTPNVSTVNKTYGVGIVISITHPYNGDTSRARVSMSISTPSNFSAFPNMYLRCTYRGTTYDCYGSKGVILNVTTTNKGNFVLYFGNGSSAGTVVSSRVFTGSFNKTAAWYSNSPYGW